jgi:hypothetical protein
MKATQKRDELHEISRQQLVALVSELLGANPNPDDTTPPGPWDPIIRKALERLGPHPEPWKPVFGPGPQPWNRVALNPLPPKAVFAAAIAQEIIDRASLMQEIADALPQAGGQQGIIAGGYLSRFIDDCGNDRLWGKRPFPPRRDEDEDKLTALELLVMGVMFEQNAQAIANEQLQKEFRKVGENLTAIGLARR